MWILNKVIAASIFSLVLMLSCSTHAAGLYTTYQAKIIKPDGNPLESSNVSFRFTILDPLGVCILYTENFNFINMTGSSGLVSFSLGSGIQTFPVSASISFSDVFNNNGSTLSCAPGGAPSYNPTSNDLRKIVMQFHDGGGWQTLPAMNINHVPYAMYAKNAASATVALNSTQLNGKTDLDFVQVTSIPTCSASQALQFNGATFGCVAVGSGGGGGALSVSGTAPIMVSGSASAPVISISVASMSSDGYLTSADYAEFKTKLSVSSTQITNTLGYAPVSSSAVATQIDAAATVSATANSLVKRDSSGNGLFNGISAGTANLNYVDLYKPSTSFNIRFQAPTSLSANYTLVFPDTTGVGGQFLTTDGSGNLSWTSQTTTTISSGDVITALGYTPANAASAGITTLNGSSSATQTFANGTGGIAPGFVTSNGIHTLNIPLASAGTTTAGLISNADYSLFSTVMNKITSSAASIAQVLGYTPADQAQVTTLSSTLAAVSSAAQAAQSTADTKITSSAVSIVQVLGYVPAASGAVGVGTLLAANNLSDVVSTTVARTNLGLGSFATRSSLVTSDVTNALGYTPANAASAGITTLNGSSSATQTFATGVTGTVFNISSLNGVHTFNIPLAASSSVTAGLLSNADYATFTNKVTSSAASIAQVLGYVPAASGAVGVGTLLAANNLSDLVSATVARTNLGLAALAELNFVDLGSSQASGTLAIARLPSFVGDATIAAASNTIILSNSGVTAGTYTKVTVDAKGRVTSSAALASSDVTTALGFTPANAASAGITTLNGSSSSTQTYAYGTAGTTTAFATANGVHTLNIPLASAASVTGGLVSNADYTTFMNKITSSAVSIAQVLGYVPAASGSAGVGTLLAANNLSDLASATIARNNLGLGSFATRSSLVTSDVTTALGYTPANAASAGITTLNGSSSSTQTFATGLTGTVFNISSLNGVHTFNIPLAASSSVIAGLLSNADYATFTSKITSSAVSIAQVLGYVPAASGSAGVGTLLAANNLSDVASATVARNNLGLGSLAQLNFVDLGSSQASGTLAIARLPSFVGDATIAASSNTIILSNSGVTAGTYTKVTVDAKGRVTSSAALASSDVTTALGYTPANAASAGITTLNGSSSSTQTYAYGTAGTTTAFNTLNGVHTLNIPLASAASVTGGLVSNADYSTFMNKITSSAASIAQVLGYVPAVSGAVANLADSGVSASTYTKVTVDSKGRVTSGSQVTLNDIVHVYTANGGLFVGSGTSRPLVDDSNTAESTAFGVNSMAANQAGGQNTAFGFATLESSVTSYENAAFGWYALQANTSGQFNTAIGAETLWSNTTGNENTAVGGAALSNNTTGYDNTAVGMVALRDNTSGSDNVGIGVNAGRTNRTGHKNVYVGAGAGNGPNNNSNVSNTTIIGYEAATNITTGADNNIVIGANSASNLTTGPNNIVIGNNINTAAATSSGTLNIGNLIFGTGVDGTGATLSTGKIGIGTKTPATKLSVSGGVQISMESATCAVSYAGTLRYNSGSVEFCNGATWAAFGVSGAGLTSLNGSTSATQTYAYGTAGTTTAFNTVNGVHTLNIPLASAASVTGGLVSNVDYTTFMNKITSSAASIAAVLGYTSANSATVLLKANNLSDLASSATARTNLGLGGFATVSSLDLGSASATGTLAVARLPAFNGDVVTTAGSSTMTVDGLQGRAVLATAPASGQILAYNGSAWAPVTAGGSQWNTSGTTINYMAGKVGIGTVNPLSVLDVVSTDTMLPGNGIIARNNSGSTLGAGMVTYRSRGTPAAPAAVADSDDISNTYALVYDGSSYITPGSFGFAVSGTVSAGSVPTDFVIRTGSSAGGSEQMRVSSSGNVGIGRTARGKLDVNGSVIVGWPGSVTGVPANSLVVSGKIGVGVANPTSALQIYSAGANPVAVLVENGGSVNGAELQLSGSDTGNRTWSLRSGGTASPGGAGAFSITATGIPGVVITSSGHFGVGTSAPTARLQLSSGTTTYAPLKFTSGTLLSAAQAGAIEYDGFNFYMTNGAGTRQIIGGQGASISATDINSTGNLNLTPTGSVVVSSTTASTNSQTGALIVKGGLGVAGNIFSSGTIITSSNIQGASVTATSGIISPFIYGSTGSSGNLVLESTTHATKGHISLAPNGGNVAIGAVNQSEKLHVSGGAAGTAGTIARFRGNSGWGSIDFYTMNTSRSFIGDANVMNSFSWETSSNSLQFLTAGNERVRIDNTGRMGIGTTTPDAKLHVSGTIVNTVNTFSAAFTCGTSTLNFSTSNFQRLSPSNTIAAGSCNVALSNLVAGGSYTLVVLGNGATNAVTYNFTGYTFKYLPINGATIAGKDTIYTFLYDGTTVYVTWTGGY